MTRLEIRLMKTGATKRKRKRPSAKALSRKAWKELSEKIRAERGACEVCGATDRLVVHHILWRRTRKDLMLEPNNLICLCAKDHFVLHRGHEVEFLEWLRRNKPEQFEWVMAQARKLNQFDRTEGGTQ